MGYAWELLWDKPPNWRNRAFLSVRTAFHHTGRGISDVLSHPPNTSCHVFCFQAKVSIPPSPVAPSSRMQPHAFAVMTSRATHPQSARYSRNPSNLSRLVAINSSLLRRPSWTWLWAMRTLEPPVYDCEKPNARLTSTTVRVNEQPAVKICSKKKERMWHLWKRELVKRLRGVFLVVHPVDPSPSFHLCQIFPAQ